jgi:hypothetical protein
MSRIDICKCAAVVAEKAGSRDRAARGWAAKEQWRDVVGVWRREWVQHFGSYCTRISHLTFKCQPWIWMSDLSYSIAPDKVRYRKGKGMNLTVVRI